MKTLIKMLVWCLLPAIAACGRSERTISIDAKPMRVTAKSGLRLRNAPSLNAVRLLTIPAGAEVKTYEISGGTVRILGKDGKWVKVNYEGTIGWAFSAYLEPVPLAGEYCFRGPHTSNGWDTQLIFRAKGRCTATINHGEGFYNYSCNYTRKGNRLILNVQLQGTEVFKKRRVQLIVKRDGSLLYDVKNSTASLIETGGSHDTWIFTRCK